MWKTLWKLKVPNKIKVFGWRAYHNILPTHVNLAQKQIIQDNRCEACKTEPETVIHALWNCGMAQDVWAGCSALLQNCLVEQDDMLQLMDEVINRLPFDELGQFLVQAWLVWHQRNAMILGKKLQELGVLNKRAKDLMEEFMLANTQISITLSVSKPMRWNPPPEP